jgi:outer membrane immunogenic protein
MQRGVIVSDQLGAPVHRYVVVLFSSAVIGLGCAPLASAADMRVKAPVYKAPPSVAYDWTGCYGGGNIGYGWQKTAATDAQPGAEPPFDAGSDVGTGAVGGGQIGCDYQFAPKWILGIQGMFDGADVNGSHVAPFSYAETNSETFATRTDWFPTLTARVGYAVWPQAMLYFKGGVAWVKSRYSDADPSGSAEAPYSGQAGGTRTGWTIGGGGEYLLQPNVSLFIEYNYVDLGAKTFGFVYDCGGSCSFSNPYHYSQKQNLQTVLFGLNYRFGMAKGWAGMTY